MYISEKVRLMVRVSVRLSIKLRVRVVLTTRMSVRVMSGSESSPEFRSYKGSIQRKSWQGGVSVRHRPGAR